ncbi:hypothetical protein CASFOL_025007 [Castilleja foliolosa]|uniref:No apical meristem-associated C-terminal domain-containing protein n=1 Tax=Castilleja foliolosa TaxID=1961234 RepID=A0ABD3CPY3_9LAMI
MDSQNIYHPTFDDKFEVESLPLPSPFEELQSNNGKKKASRKHNFSIEEDLMLVSAWLNVSLDAGTSGNQTHKTYWGRMHDYFHEHKTFQSDRNSNSLMKRWSIINLAVCKFCGFFAQVEGLNQSGKTDQDKIQDSKMLYQNTQGLSFPYEHCWNILRFQEKWIQVTYKNKSKKKAKRSENDSRSNSSPIGLEDNELDVFFTSSEMTDKNKSKKKAKRSENDSPSNLSPIGLEDNELDVFTSSEMTHGIDVENRKINIFENSPDMRMASCMEQFVECKRNYYEERKKKSDRDHEESVMSKDLSNMNEFQVLYWKKKQEEILREKGWI